MYTYSNNYSSDHSIEEIYSLIVDIESYPEFIPWCSAARILEREDNIIIAELVIFFKGFTESYTSRVEITPPKDGKAVVEVNMVTGPFKYLHNSWKLKSIDKGTTINFFIDFSFKSHLLERVMGFTFKKACASMMEAFERRANKLFGKKE